MTQRTVVRLLFAALLVVAPATLALSPTIPEWQTAAGGKMAFEAASIRLSAPDTRSLRNLVQKILDVGAILSLMLAGFGIMRYVASLSQAWRSASVTLAAPSTFVMRLRLYAIVARPISAFAPDKPRIKRRGCPNDT